MQNNLAQAIDKIYNAQHSEIELHLFQTIGQTLLYARQGQTPEQVSKQVGITPEQVKEVVIRVKGWELSYQMEQEQHSCYT